MKNFNIIHVADIHFGKKDDKRLNEEIMDFLNTIKNIQKENEEKIDMICIEGDLYDRVIKMNEPTSSYIINFVNELCEFTNKERIYFRIIKGTKTHDFNQLNVFKKLESTYPLFKIIDMVEEEEIEKNHLIYKFLYLPEEYPENVYEYYAPYFNNEYDFILGHGMIDFVAFTGNEDESSERMVRNAPVFKANDLINITKGIIVFGHIHDFHSYKDKIYYVGSYSRFSFADKEDKGFLYSHYNKKTGETDIDFYENELAPTYFEIDLNKKKFNSVEDQVKYIKKIKEKYDYVKIKTNKETQNLDLIKSIVSEDPSVKLEVKNLDFDEDKVDDKFLFILNREYDLPTTVKKFISITKEKNIPIEKIKEILKPE